MKQIILRDHIDNIINSSTTALIDIEKCHDDSFADKAINLNKDNLEKSYLNLIASLGKSCKSFAWWASVLSEKNDITSKLFIRLYKLAYLDKFIKTVSQNKVMIICSDTVLKEQIIHNYNLHYSKAEYLHRRIQIILAFFKGIIKQTAKAVDECGKILSSRRILSGKNKEILADKKWFVLRTWVDQRNYKSGNYSDSYFKSLPHFIKKGNKPLLIFAGILSGFKSNLLKFKEDKDYLIIPTNFYLKATDIIRCLFMTYFGRPNIVKPVNYCGLDVTILINYELFYDIATTGFFSALLQYYSCFRLASEVSVRQFIYTFENYAWEKMSILGVRRADLNVKVVGFQHAFIAKNSFKYFPGQGEEFIAPLPDRIVTMGNSTQNIMRRLGNYPENIFLTGCSLRQEYLFNLSLLPRNLNGDIFVPLTITVEDTVNVLHFIFKAGLGLRPEKIYLRFHPATSQKTVMEKLKFKLPPNFIISDNPPMVEELKRSKVVLYTSTTVCLEALKMGRPVIHLNVNYPLEVDPLFECGHLKDSCKKPEELVGKIERLCGLNDEHFYQELGCAESYLRDYFIPVNEQTLEPFVV